MTTELVDAMRHASETDDPDARRAIYGALARAEVYVPTTGDDLLAVEGRDGAPVALAFTDLDAMRNWSRPGSTWGSLRGDDLATRVLAAGATALVLNVHGPYGGELGRRELELVAAGEVFDVSRLEPDAAVLTVRDGSAVSLRPATSAPARIAEAAARAAEATGGVEAAYLLQVDAPGPPHLAIGTAWDDVAPAIAERLGRELAPDELVDLLPLSGRLLDSLAEATPLFSRRP